jgi:hypothetical protein
MFCYPIHPAGAELTRVHQNHNHPINGSTIQLHLPVHWYDGNFITNLSVCRVRMSKN